MPTPKTVTFASFTRQEEPHVERIIDRAQPRFHEVGVVLSKLDLRMDLAAVHATCPLRLAELAAADELNFSHDLTGIYRHLNRQTGELEDCFVPRFAKPEGAS